MQLSKKFKEVFAKIKDKDDSQRTNIIELIRGLFFKMYELRDHIFGFPEDLKENTKVQINQYFKTLKTMESYLENELFDDLTEIGNFFTNLPFDNNEILSKDWDNYKIIEFDNIPSIKTSVINRVGYPYLGVGEAVAGPTGASISNAIRRALGERIKTMPFSQESIKKQLLG